MPKDNQQAKRPSPDSLMKSTPKGEVELTERDLDKITAGSKDGKLPPKHYP